MRVLNPAPPLNRCVNLYTFSMLQFPHLHNGDDNGDTVHRTVMGIVGFSCIKCIESCQLHGKDSINVSYRFQYMLAICLTSTKYNM